MLSLHDRIQKLKVRFPPVILITIGCLGDSLELAASSGANVCIGCSLSYIVSCEKFFKSVLESMFFKSVQERFLREILVKASDYFHLLYWSHTP